MGLLRDARRRVRRALSELRDAVAVRRAGAALLLLSVVLAACNDATSTSSNLGDLLLPSGPPGYIVMSSAFNGPLDAEHAAQATPAEPAALRPVLTGSAFQGAYSHAWSMGSDYVTDLVYAFSNAPAAARLVHLETQSLQASQVVSVFPLDGIPNGETFVFYGRTRESPRDVFCDGAWLTVGSRAYELMACGARPQNSGLAEQLAVAQYERAATASESPSAGR